ncbi:MAG: hypothetical protein U1E70_14950 [Acetobacteraceae bacterium]
MRNARLLRAELDLWKLAWQQIETFLDRIEGAQNQDRAAANKVAALLRVAQVIEHQRAARYDVKYLCDPFIDRQTTQWDRDYRKWRIPGTDELELAVGSLATNDDDGALESVVLFPPADLFEVSVEPSDPRAAEAVDGMVTVRLPSYPASGNQTIFGTPIDYTVPGALIAPPPALDIEEEDDTTSLFSRDARKQAATDVDRTQDRVRSWSDLCRTRRGVRAGAAESEVKGCGGSTPAAPQLWQASFDAQARAIVAATRANTLYPNATGILGTVASAARNAITIGSADAAALTAAKEVLAKEGTQSETLLPAIETAESALGGQPNLFRDVAAAADALGAAVQSPPMGWPVASATQTLRNQRATTLIQALDRLAPILAPLPLFLLPPEDGAMAEELDRAVKSRIGYPDGSLRTLRALETTFLATWPTRLFWLRQRYDLVLRPIVTRVRAPFIAGLRALLRGGPTGLPVQGLDLRTQAPVGGETLSLEQPASMGPALDVIEVGHVGMLMQDRPTAAIILGLASSGGRIELNTLPLSVSVAPTSDAPGSPGLVPGGQEILTYVPGSGFTDGELRAGEANAGPAWDGLMRQTLSLWSRLALVFGRSRIDGEIAPTHLPDPSSAPLQTLALYGEVPAQASTIVISALPSGFWNRVAPDDPVPLLGRPGETLLLRGRGEPDAEGAAGQMRQSVVEVDSVFRTTGSMLRQMDTSSAALLSAVPAEGAASACPALVCGPEEDVVVLLLKRSWQRKKLVSDVTLRRDFLGFDLPSLATERLLPEGVLDRLLDAGERISDGGVERGEEFAAALETLAGWTRYAR